MSAADIIMANFEPNAIIRGAQLTAVGSECPISSPSDYPETAMRLDMPAYY